MLSNLGEWSQGGQLVEDRKRHQYVTVTMTLFWVNHQCPCDCCVHVHRTEEQKSSPVWVNHLYSNCIKCFIHVGTCSLSCHKQFSFSPQFAASKLQVLEMMKTIGQYISDKCILERIVPYLVCSPDVYVIIFACLVWCMVYVHLTVFLCMYM